MNKYEQAYLNVDTNSCTEEDCKVLQDAIDKASKYDAQKEFIKFIISNIEVKSNWYGVSDTPSEYTIKVDKKIDRIQSEKFSKLIRQMRKELEDDK